MAGIELGKVFKAEEIERAAEMLAECPPGKFASRFAEEVVAPVLDRINKATGHEWDAKYLAYAMENALEQAPASPRR